MDTIILLVGPSGSGKTTAIEGSGTTVGLKQLGYTKMVSDTTRPPRKHLNGSVEVDGIDYNFIEDSMFRFKEKLGKYFETIVFDGYKRGMPKSAIVHKGVKEVEPEGMKVYRKNYNSLVVFFDLSEKLLMEQLSKSRSPSEIELRLKTDNIVKRFKATRVKPDVVIKDDDVLGGRVAMKIHQAFQLKSKPKKDFDDISYEELAS